MVKFEQPNDQDIIRNQEDKTEKFYFELDGIRYYAEQIRPVDQIDIDRLMIPTESLLHISRHLNSFSEEAKSKLIGQTILEKDNEIVIDDNLLNNLIKTAGSKFNLAITDPEKLAIFCKQKMQEVINSNKAPFWYRKKSLSEWSDFMIKVTNEDKKRFGIPINEYFGTESVIKITPELSNLVVSGRRGYGQEADSFEVNTIQGIKVPQTDNLIISLKRSDINKPAMLFSAFTGIKTPPLPRLKEQLPEEYQYNKDWWSKYAFIK